MFRSEEEYKLYTLWSSVLLELHYGLAADKRRMPDLPNSSFMFPGRSASESFVMLGFFDILASRDRTQRYYKSLRHYIVITFHFIATLMIQEVGNYFSTITVTTSERIKIMRICLSSNLSQHFCTYFPNNCSFPEA